METSPAQPDTPMKRKESYKQQCLQVIKKHGRLIQQVGVSGWAYTVGLTKSLGYELICTGLPPQVSHSVLNQLADKLSAAPVADDQPITELTNMPVILRTIDLATSPDLHILITTAHLVGMPPTKLRHLIWPDPAGNFPGSPDYDFPVSQDLQALAAVEHSKHSVPFRAPPTMH